MCACCSALPGWSGEVWRLRPRAFMRCSRLPCPGKKNVVEPLRQVRLQWRAMAQLDLPLAALRERVKTLELEAERELLARLEVLTQAWPTEEGDQRGWLESLAAGAANLDHDALQQLRVVASGT